MAFYKLEAVFPTIAVSNRKQTYRSSKTYKYFLSSYESMVLRMEDSLEKKAKVTVKEISEAEYVKSQCR